MKNKSLCAPTLFLILTLCCAPALKGQDVQAFSSTAPTEGEILFVYLGYSGVLVRTASQTIAIDPANLLTDKDIEALKKADLSLVLYTHGHGDHFALPTALEIFKATQVPIVAEAGVAGQLQGKIPAEKLTRAEGGKSFTFGKIVVDCVEGVHIGPIILFRIKMGDVDIFHGGDSNYVSLSDYPSQLAFLPAGRPSPTASPEAAFRMASDLKPESVVVFHGSDAQYAEFQEKMKKAFPETAVLVPEAGKLSKLVLRR